MRRLITVAILSARVLPAADARLSTALAKLSGIEDGKLRPGAVVFFSVQEINAWAVYEVPQIVPQGIRNQRVTLGAGTGTAYAQMDFLKMRHAEGKVSGWFMERMIEGERPVTISIRLQSGAGYCTVDLTRVEISGVAATGTVLDFLVKTFFMPLYPAAKIGEKFEIGYSIDRIEIRPTGVRVTMKK